MCFVKYHNHYFRYLRFLSGNVFITHLNFHSVFATTYTWTKSRNFSFRAICILDKYNHIWLCHPIQVTVYQMDQWFDGNFVIFSRHIMIHSKSIIKEQEFYYLIQKYPCVIILVRVNLQDSLVSISCLQVANWIELEWTGSK